jgi:cytoskeletal protein RodZ
MWKKTILHFTCSGFLLCGMIFGRLAAGAQQGPAANEPSQAASSTAQTNSVATSTGTDQTELPDSPGVVASEAADKPQATSRNQFDLQATQASQVPQSPTVQSQSAQSQSQVQEQQSTAPQAPVQKPVGTAVAGPPLVSGIAASQPAGVAIAPAKQHRVLTIVLRTGAIIGAAVAVGTVVALTAATPSKPPGAH